MMRKGINPAILIALVLVSLLPLAGCRPDWAFSLAGLPGGQAMVDYGTWESNQVFAVDDAIPLEQILYGSGARVIDSISVTDTEGNTVQYDWADAAGSLQVTRKGLLIGGEREIRPESILVSSSKWEDLVEGHIYDIAPTAARALGIPVPALSTGEALGDEAADHVLLLFLDGFGYLRYQESLEEGLIPVLGQLEPPLVGLTTYPPITTISSASLLTGTEPPIHGVQTRGIRTTDQETLFDVAQAAGLRVVAVEGEALAFNLRSADLELSGDRDGNGATDDNVLANALAVLESGMPDLLYVHFHGIDDRGHDLGPGASAEEEKISEVDAAAGQIMEALPPGTLVIIFADHGMHQVEEDGRLGNHGHLIPRDMLIPIWIVRK